MPADSLSATLAAISDPTRRAILAHLLHGEATVTELAEPFDVTLPAITKHLKVLEHAGLLTRRRDAQRRPCQLRPEGLKAAADWIDVYRDLWEQRLDRMAAYVKQLQRDGGQAGVTPSKTNQSKSRAKRK
ncbi:MAG: metalloregulator ArsR/SmtB family transcription factor [Planctomycetota bacterium]